MREFEQDINIKQVLLRQAKDNTELNDPLLHHLLLETIKYVFWNIMVHNKLIHSDKIMRNAKSIPEILDANCKRLMKELAIDQEELCFWNVGISKVLKIFIKETY